MKADIEKLKERIEKAKKQIINANQQIKDNLTKQIFSETFNLYQNDFKDIEQFKTSIKKIFTDNKFIISIKTKDK